MYQSNKYYKTKCMVSVRDIYIYTLLIASLILGPTVRVGPKLHPEFQNSHPKHHENKIKSYHKGCHHEH